MLSVKANLAICSPVTGVLECGFHDKEFQFLCHFGKSSHIYIVCEQSKCHQPLVHMLSCDKYFPLHVVRALFHI